METVNVQSVKGLGLTATSPAEARKFTNTSYTVDVGQPIFQKSSRKIDSSAAQDSEKDIEYINSLNLELTADHVPLGEILERLQSDEPSDKNNLIRLHSASDNSASTISATLNVATLDLSSNPTYQHQFQEFNDVLFSIKSDCSPSPTSTSSSLMSSPSFSPNFVPDVPFLNNNSQIGTGEFSSKHSVQTCQNSNVSPSSTSSEAAKPSPQECSLCSKIFGNASALAKHRLTHSDERKYLCTVCHKAFKRQDHLNGHLLTHRNKKPFECSAQGCSKSYCDARSLRRHRENHHSVRDDKMMVSPTSSVSSSIDLEEKSFGSDTFDSIRQLKSRYIPDKDKPSVIVESPQMNILERYIRSDQTSSGVKGKPQPVTNQLGKEAEPSNTMVECTICERRFKNIPALNGHMRLHGGYYRKENDKRQESKESVTTNHTVSTNVKNLIEEKIIQKRKLEPMQGSTEIRFSVSSVSCPNSVPGSICLKPVPTTSLPNVPVLVSEPSAKISKSSLDNLIFPLLPQPDTSKLLDNLENKSSHIQHLLPNQPLPNVPLPSSKLLSTMKSVNSSKNTVQINNLLKNRRKEPRLGIQYQATVPALQDRILDDKTSVISKETLMWSPETNKNISQAHIDSFLKFCSSTAVSISLTDEDALQVLNRNQGNVFRATQEILSFPWSQGYRLSGKFWLPDQVDMFYEALCRHKKNFSKICNDIPGKSVKDCIQFYYTWKNLCREESRSFKSIVRPDTKFSSNLSL